MMLQYSSFFRLLGCSALCSSLLVACVNKSVNVDQTMTPTEGAGGDSGVSPDPDSVADGVLAVSGQVTDLETGKAIAGALVMTEPPIGQIRTNAEGLYVFVGQSYPDLHANTLYRITATHDDYTMNFAQVLLQQGHNRNVDIQLERAMASYYLVVSQTTVNLTDKALGATLDVNIDTQSDDMTTYNATVDINARSWLSIDPASATISGTPSSVDVVAKPDGLDPGTYHGEITIKVSGDSKTISVTFDHN